MQFTSSFSSLLGLLAIAPVAVSARNAFCHYLVGTVNSDHVKLDIDQAKSMGFDAFALDILDPTASWSQNTVQELFNYAGTAGFKLFFSIDVGSHPNLADFKPVLQQYLGNKAYYTDTPNGFPFLSTFNSDVNNGDSVSTWSGFLGEFVDKVYFVPDFDDDSTYYSNINQFFNNWSSVPLSGVFSWDTAWPEQSSSGPQNESISRDETVITAAHGKQKSYMIPLSSLQFKQIGTSQNWYRGGAVNLPERMTDILSLNGNAAPEYVEVITWNDGGESHYIGNVWPEGSDYGYDYTPNNSQQNLSHAAWQPLVTSFVSAFKQSQTAASMVPPSNSPNGVGAFWYNSLLKSASCAGSKYGRPNGWQGIADAVNYAVVLPKGSKVAAANVYSGDLTNPIQKVAIDGQQGGLSYMSVPGLKTGAQKVDLLDGQGNVLASGQGQVNVEADSPGCNFNPLVYAIDWK